MDTYQIIGFVVLGAIVGVFFGSAFIVYYSQHLIKTGKRVPHFLREVDIEMPIKYKK